MNKIQFFINRHFVSFVTVVLILLLALISPQLFGFHILTNLITNSIYLLIAVLGVIFIILSGQFDLSIGYMMALTGAISFTLTLAFKLHGIVALFLAIAIGAGLSTANILLSYCLNCPLYLVTLATSMIFKGCSYCITLDKTLTAFPASFKALTHGSLAGIRIPIFYLLIILCLTFYILRYTYVGRQICALGTNAKAVEMAGISILRLRIFTALISGSLVGFSTFIMASESEFFYTRSAEGMETTLILAAFLGGIGLHQKSGGHLIDALASVILLAYIDYIFSIYGIPRTFKFIIRGSLMLFAIFADYLANRKKSNKTGPGY